ncbi:stage III sporulation protein AF [Jeotgalibacillus sp. ET6]|uniref:stage III sporulation protein AF n=1 Tax=Jeotgalibacillus sp. ET6 TaxID=3037260 RepID=UPI0024181E41|nr:stage III sporulation protein AF [Jeotgalibacillus sp. ET6]MDG5470767.1 stage III sporulation protein AF [Jeotgalibacillus sp. ET6]
MDAVYQWVINLLVLVVLMALSDLLIPSNSWRPFVRLALGGLLLILLLEPLFYFFRNEQSIVTVPFSQIEDSIAAEQEEGQAMIHDMNNKHQSYIWSEVSDKLAKQVNPIVLEQFNIELSNVTVWPNDSSIEEFKGEVEVELNSLSQITSDNEQELLLLLAQEWGVPVESITLTHIGE